MIFKIERKTIVILWSRLWLGWLILFLFRVDPKAYSPYSLLAALFLLFLLWARPFFGCPLAQ